MDAEHSNIPPAFVVVLNQVRLIRLLWLPMRQKPLLYLREVLEHKEFLAFSDLRLCSKNFKPSSKFLSGLSV